MAADIEATNAFNALIDELKGAVQLMRREMESRTYEQDFIWPDVIRCFEYVQHLAPADFRRIRLHTGLITGEFVYQYWHKYPPLDPEQYARESGYTQLIAGVPADYQIGESVPADFPITLGVDYQGKVLNKNTVRYQSCLANLYHLQVLERLNQRSERARILEIGGGYGALAHHLVSVLKHCTYFLVDLPPMLLFSGAYFKLLHPEARVFVYHPEQTEVFAAALERGFADYDLVLLPAYLLDRPQPIWSTWPALDLVINMMSFQEMPKEVIDHYLNFAARHLEPEHGLIYSNNIDRHPCNLDTRVNVTQQLAQFFQLFPEPERYADPELNADHPWYYRFFAGRSRQLTGGFPDRIRLMARAYVPQNQLSPSGFFEPQWKYFEL